MGQQIATECQCNDGFLQLCVPQGPLNEHQSEMNDIRQAPYPGSSVPFAPSDDIINARPNENVAASFESLPEERPSVAAAVSQEDYTSMTGLPPPSPSRGSPPLMLPHKGRPVLSGRNNITQEDIISNLEDAEEMLYGRDTFAMLLSGQQLSVGLDSAAMRDFILSNSTISSDDIDMELLKVASPDEGLSREAFLCLLREFPVSEANSISSFMELSENGETIASEECRTGLLLFGQQQLASNLSDEQWERILNSVMRDAGVAVKLEEWLVYCKLLARMVRLLRLAQVHKSAYSSSHGSNIGGVIGGA